jgi:hypothetical protein
MKRDISIVAIGFYSIWVGNIPKLAMDSVLSARRCHGAAFASQGRHVDSGDVSFQECGVPFNKANMYTLKHHQYKVMVCIYVRALRPRVPWAKGADVT